MDEALILNSIQFASSKLGIPKENVHDEQRDALIGFLKRRDVFVGLPTGVSIFPVFLLLVQAVAVMLVLYVEVHKTPQYEKRTANSYHHKRFMSAPSEFSHITDQINDEGQLTTVAQLTSGGEQFRTVTDVVSGLRKNVIMTCVNRGFLPLLINLLYSIQQLNIRNLPPILIICEDQEAYLEMSKVKGNFSMNMLLTLTNMNESVSEATAFKSDDYKNLVQKRVSYIGIFLQSGINIFYIDSDIVLLENPFSFFRGNFDLFIQNELPGKTDLCTGFFYLRANERTVALVQAWEELLPTDPSGNQRVFNIVVRKMRNKKVERKKKLKLKVLPMDRFLSGKVFRLSGNQSWIERNPKPVEIHANFLVGIESKIDMLKNNDLWFVEH